MSEPELAAGLRSDAKAVWLAFGSQFGVTIRQYRLAAAALDEGRVVAVASKSGLSGRLGSIRVFSWYEGDLAEEVAKFDLAPPAEPHSTLPSDNDEQRLPWSSVFKPSVLGSNVFFVSHAHDPGLIEICNSFGAPVETKSGMFDSSKWIAALLDGAVFKEHRYGFMGLDGLWVVGHRLLYLLCDECELTRPKRRLKLQLDAMPPVSALRSEALSQTDTEREQLQHWCKTAMDEFARDDRGTIRRYAGRASVRSPTSS